MDDMGSNKSAVPSSKMKKSRSVTKKSHTTKHQHRSLARVAQSVASGQSSDYDDEIESDQGGENGRRALYSEGSVASIVLNKLYRGESTGSRSSKSKRTSSWASASFNESTDLPIGKSTESDELEVNAENESRLGGAKECNADDQHGPSDPTQLAESQQEGNNTNEIEETKLESVPIMDTNSVQDETGGTDAPPPSAATHNTENESVGDHVRQRGTIMVRSQVKKQPRPSPPFTSLVKVVEGPYKGMSGTSSLGKQMHLWVIFS